MKHKHPSSAPAFNRRRFVKSIASGAIALTSASSFRVLGSGFSPYQGKLLVTLQLDGGADVTQLCDPKTNTPGEPKINNWADAADVGEAGNIRFAPIANNAQLFQRHGANMVVVNGVDAQTNSHETGRLFNWTGSNAEGRPSLSAIHAAAKSLDKPLAYTVFGGTSRTAGLLTYNRFDDLNALRTLTAPNISPWDTSQTMRPEREVQTAQAQVRSAISALLAGPSLTSRQRQSVLRQQEALEGRDSLRRLADILPSEDQIEPSEEFTVGEQMFWSNLRQQIQSAFLVFQSGLGSTADLMLSGFDSHDNHDPIHALLYTHLAESIDYFWDTAEAMGLADRIVLVVGSDFGRTNFYNDGDGKDHWPIASYMIMEQGAPWGNRVVGATDELHFARSINPSTLATSNNGVILTPAHIHKSLQKYLGIESYARSVGFDFAQTETIPLFDRSKQTRT